MIFLRKTSRLIFYSLAFIFLSANALYAKNPSPSLEEEENKEDSSLKIRKKFPSYRVQYDFNQVIKEVTEEIEAESEDTPSKK